MRCLSQRRLSWPQKRHEGPQHQARNLARPQLTRIRGEANGGAEVGVDSEVEEVEVLVVEEQVVVVEEAEDHSVLGL